MMARDDTPPVDPGRRSFARGLLGLLGMAQETLQGVPQMAASDLGSVPEEVLAEMVPVFREGDDLEAREDGLYRAYGEQNGGRVVALSPTEVLMVNQYHCGRNLRTIAREVAAPAGLTEAQAFTACRALFIRLARGGWCHPAAAHLPPRKGDHDHE